MKTWIIVAYLVVLVFFTSALFLAFRRYGPVKGRDVLALLGLILMTLLYIATLLVFGGLFFLSLPSLASVRSICFYWLFFSSVCCITGPPLRFLGEGIVQYSSS
ncbi:MAG: hypothetical protein ACJ797_25790 [Ktedonobacteraceae bacterium]